MNLDLSGIIKRLQIVTDTSSGRAMCIALGLSETSVGNWKRQDTIPYKACFLAAKQSGYSMEWILTGEGKIMLYDDTERSTEADVNPERLSSDFSEIIADGVELGFLAPTPETTAETLDILGRKLYRRYTGQLTTLNNIQGKAKNG